MATKRQKKVLLTCVSQEDAEQAFAAYAKADAQLCKITADVELQCAKVREKRQEEVMRLGQEKESAFDTLQAYALEHRDELFSKKKSLDMVHGTIGFRIGTPKLKTLKGFTWASALNLVKEFLPSFIRTSEEIAKDKLLADRDADEVQSNLSKCGITVSQDESFFVEPKKEEGSL